MWKLQDELDLQVRHSGAYDFTICNVLEEDILLLSPIFIPTPRVGGSGRKPTQKCRCDYCSLVIGLSWFDEWHLLLNDRSKCKTESTHSEYDLSCLSLEYQHLYDGSRMTHTWTFRITLAQSTLNSGHYFCITHSLSNSLFGFPK